MEYLLRSAGTLAVLVKSKILENTKFGIVTYILFLNTVWPVYEGVCEAYQMLYCIIASDCPCLW